MRLLAAVRGQDHLMLCLSKRHACAVFCLAAAVTCVPSGANGVNLVLNCTVNGTLPINTTWSVVCETWLAFCFVPVQMT